MNLPRRARGTDDTRTSSTSARLSASRTYAPLTAATISSRAALERTTDVVQTIEVEEGLDLDHFAASYNERLHDEDDDDRISGEDLGRHWEDTFVVIGRVGRDRALSAAGEPERSVLGKILGLLRRA